MPGRAPRPGQWSKAPVDLARPWLDDGGSYIASAAYGTAGVPFAILIDGDGDVVARWAGERSVEQIETALTELAAS